MKSARWLLGQALRIAILLRRGTVILALAAILPGVDTPSFDAAVLVAAAMALINALLWPVVIRVALPLTVFTFGLASLPSAPGRSRWRSTWSTAASPVLGDLAIAFALALCRRSSRRCWTSTATPSTCASSAGACDATRKENHTDVPGVILFEIDGLGETVLREAVRDGHVPTIARWLSEGSHRLIGWECDLSSQTGASQAGLLLGSNWDMPAFRWYEKESGRTLVSNHPADAAEIERRRSTGEGLLAGGGTSRGNMFSGDAPRCTATMSVIRDRTRSKAGDLFAYFADPYGFLRTIVLSLADIAASAGRRGASAAAAPSTSSGGRYPLIRAAITVVMRDLDHGAADGRHRRGRAGQLRHVRGLRRGRPPLRHPRARRAGGAQAPRSPARAPGARRAQAPRPYHLVVLSDHGQTQGAPFRQRYGETLEEVVRDALAHGEVRAPAAVDEAWGDVGAVLADARQELTVGGARSRARRAAERWRAPSHWGPTARRSPSASAPAGAGEEEAVVLVSGGLGLVYLPIEHRASAARADLREPTRG